jgi:hypothetical protein
MGYDDMIDELLMLLVLLFFAWLIGWLMGRISAAISLRVKRSVDFSLGLLIQFYQFSATRMMGDKPLDDSQRKELDAQLAKMRLLATDSHLRFAEFTSRKLLRTSKGRSPETTLKELHDFIRYELDGGRVPSNLPNMEGLPLWDARPDKE